MSFVTAVGTVIEIKTSEKLTILSVAQNDSEVVTVKSWYKVDGIVEGDRVMVFGALNQPSTETPGYRHAVEITAESLTKTDHKEDTLYGSINGHVGQDPKSGQTKNGKTYARLSIGAKSGKESYWLNVQLWGKDAEYAAKYVRKGDLVSVAGKINWTEYKEVKSTELVGKIQTLKKKDAAGQVPLSVGFNSPVASDFPSAFKKKPSFDEDVAF